MPRSQSGQPTYNLLYLNDYFQICRSVWLPYLHPSATVGGAVLVVVLLIWSRSDYNDEMNRVQAAAACNGTMTADQIRTSAEERPNRPACQTLRLYMWLRS